MTDLSRQIQAEIQRNGWVSFADFMTKALYDSKNGYYCKGNRIGKSGDFFTNVSVGPLFAELLTFQICRWLENLTSEIPLFHLVEAGAHDGRLAHDILKALWKAAPGLATRLEYWIIEPSNVLRSRQERTLAQYRNVRWFDSPAAIRGRIHGVFFSNELLDAMPVHVFRWKKATDDWHEMGVGLCDTRFTWVELPEATVHKPELPTQLLEVLPDGFTVESSPAAMRWWTDAAAALAVGKLMTIDYGGVFEELLSPARRGGTLRAYSRHRVSPNVLDEPGEQDITAHVNFTELESVGIASGLKTEMFTTQSCFFTEIARQLWTADGSWPREKVREFQTLTHPEHLGRSFRVLVQGR